MKTKLWLLAATSVMALWGQGGVLGCDQAWRFNPCGTVLSTNICTPNQWYAALFNQPAWNVDPTCPIPGQCGTNTTPLP